MSTQERHVWHVEAELEDLGSETLPEELRAAFERKAGRVDQVPDEIRPHVERALEYGGELARHFVRMHGRSPGTLTFDGLSSGVVQVQIHDRQRVAGLATLSVPPDVAEE